jgi:RHS repeat-associated protein
VLEVRKNADTDPLEEFAWHPYYVDALAVRFYDSDINGSQVDHYYAQDANFNVVAVSNSSGAVLERYRYSAYGELTVLDAGFTLDSDGDSDISNGVGYTGRLLDPETSLDYYRNRNFDPTIGRFLSRDPLEYVDGMDMYVYARANPLRNTDSMGTKIYDLPATPQKCDYVNFWADIFARGRNRDLWEHWHDGSGVALELPFFWFDSTGFFREGELDASASLAVQNARDVECNESGTSRHVLARPPVGQRDSNGVSLDTYMIFGFEYWYECASVATKKCNWCGGCLRFDVTTLCSFHASDFVDYNGGAKPFPIGVFGEELRWGQTCFSVFPTAICIRLGLLHHHGVRPCCLFSR